jgi:hypothetical protein
MNTRFTALALLVAVGIGSAAAAAPARADEVTVVVGPHAVPMYNAWQPGWDHRQFDRRHVILGTVVDFQPFRLQVARRNGVIQAIDLKDGTVILPTGATPMRNERVAIVGYYSRGTFIANRVLIHA